MSEPAITTQVHQPFDVHGDFRSKLPFYLEFVVDYLADIVDLRLGKIIGIGVRIDFELVENPIGSGSSDTVDIGQTDFYPFTSR